MGGEYDEDYWYGKIGWPRLRKKIVRVAEIQADAFFSALNDRDRGGDRELVDAFVADIIMAVGEIAERQVRARISDMDQESGLHPSSGMWSFALPLFGDAEKLGDALEKEVALLRGFTNRDVKPRAALGQIMNSFLENARRGLSESTMHRQKTWEMIDRVSLDVARLNLGTVLEQRSSDEHLEAVQRALREKYPTNKNVNVTLDTLQGYFDEFCPDCEERNHQDLLALGSETDLWPAFDVCLDSLKRQHVELWESVAARFSMEEFADVTQQAYMAKMSLTRTAYEERMSRAKLLLAECVEKSINFQLRRR